ncbi:cobalamin biosynthesis protein [Rhodopseudomonas pseudopalustris]|uniref:Cobalt-precorrin 5A hydrolase n=1 Tax=Rhodopseudomonas pseudopalustris TaxID=1513892 RepID=A0A1H8VMF8_9BRAD|nr:cobalamin biosynthesis protein [Rhodopseudomonas pseudopalustris]SEP16494.1 cobalt-precorrin 5A hydrolase [Rhodopseudomonas pseudopalustris]
MTAVVIGVGFRSAARASSITDVIEAASRAVAPRRPTALATPADKAGHTALLEAASAASLPVRSIDDAALRQSGGRVATSSPLVTRHRGVGSVCEAAALAATGPAARLLVPRLISQDRLATAAVAIEEPTP